VGKRDQLDHLEDLDHKEIRDLLGYKGKEDLLDLQVFLV
jgi:hypothetical protein